MDRPTYHPELSQKPFGLGRHGESEGNAGSLSQGRGEGTQDEPNGLTPTGVDQVRAAVPALAAAGFEVQYVSSSELTRAQESAATLIDASPHPQPEYAGVVAEGDEHGLKEVSQKGWEGLYDRERTKELRKQKLRRFMGQLAATGELDQRDIEDYAAWVMRFGDSGENEGESPLGAALRGIQALENHGVKPGEVVMSHAMLNRYMDAIATTLGAEDRARLSQLMEDESDAGRAAVIKALKELGIKDFKTHDSAANRQANAGVTEYTVDLETGHWIPGRRIEPARPESGQAYVEHRRNAETGKWEQVTPGSVTGDNE